MNKLKLTEAVHLIDDSLVNEAANPVRRPIMRHGVIYAAGSVAAAAVVALGGAAIYRSQHPGAALRRDPASAAESSMSAEMPEQTAEPAPESTSARTEGTVLTGDTPAYVPGETDQPQVTEPPVQTAFTTAETALTTAPQTISTTVTVVTGTTEISTVSETEQKGGVSDRSVRYQPFAATVDPETDSYSTEEAFHIDVRTADLLYRQMRPEEYAEQGIPALVSVGDFGAYIGRITETDSTSEYHGNAAESQEPNIAGADVYYFAGRNRGFIIVQKDKACSVFFADTVSTESGLKKGLAQFDVQSAGDIAAVRIAKNVPDGARMVTAAEKTLTAREPIEQLYTLLCGLTPEDYSALPAHIGTPQWLNDAWAAYRANPTPRADYEITFVLEDGTALRAAAFQPYLGNGYVSGMQELTPAQHDALLALVQ